MSRVTPALASLHDRSPGPPSFLEEVRSGLRQRQKTLPCKYFYDAYGSQLFDQICELEEYYLTRTEMEILHTHAREIVAQLGPGCLLVEYGSGSSTKTRILLDHLPDPVAYVPIDISREHLIRSAARLKAAYKDLTVLPVCADYTYDGDLPDADGSAARVVVYFPGSTIGNFEPAAARAFLARIARLCTGGGALLIGVDLQKDLAALEAAYNDARGVTAAFNLNLLRRLNRELGATFRLDEFRHRAFYNAEEGRIEMHLESVRAQEVELAGEVIGFRAGETIHTENSYKYTLVQFAALAEEAGFAVGQVWTDARHRFSVQYLLAR